jgi:trehalose 6-phosphate phosphatase
VAEALLGHRASAVVCTDYDGTLAPIVLEPEFAAPGEGAVPALIALAGRVGTVAVVSGRPAGFLRRQLGEQVAATCWLIGRYGAERVPPGSPIEHAAIDPTLRRDLGTVLAEARRLVPDALLEDKGSSVALHWRARPDAAIAFRELANTAAARFGLEIRPGKLLVELVEPGTPDKGRALERLLVGATGGCFIGDDLGDLLAFDALDRFEANGGVALRVAVAGAETPPELPSSADLVLGTPADVAAFLEELAAAP